MSLWVETENGTIVRADHFDLLAVSPGDEGSPAALIGELGTTQVLIAVGDEERLRICLHALRDRLTEGGKTLMRFVGAETPIAPRIELPSDHPDTGHRAD